MLTEQDRVTLHSKAEAHGLKSKELLLSSLKFLWRAALENSLELTFQSILSNHHCNLLCQFSLILTILYWTDQKFIR